MADTNLNQFYDTLKSELNPTAPAKTLTYQQRATANQLYNTSSPKQLAYRAKAVQECDKFKENCAKRLLLDVYMKVLPFDPGYADSNRGQCQSDVDSMLGDKKMTAQDYFKSAYAETKAPLLEYVIRSISDLGKAYMEVAKEKSDEAADADIELEDPPETDEEDADSSIVDIKGDIEYEDFIEKLKKKTVNKIVKDISELINQKREDKEMTFSPEEPPAEPSNDDLSLESTELGTEGVIGDIKAKLDANRELAKKEEEIRRKEQEKQDMLNRLREDEIHRNMERDMTDVINSRKWPNDKVNNLVNKGVIPKQTALAAGYNMESTFMIVHNYITESLAKSQIVDPMDNEEIIGLAIRESTLNAIDCCFEMPNSKVEHFRTKIRLGNGVLVNKKFVEDTILSFTNPDDIIFESKSDTKDRSLTPEEKAIADKRFGEVECSIMYREGEGYFAKTHRARTKFYDSLEKLPKDKVKFVSSTS